MNDASELKKNLIHRINQTNDLGFLNTLQAIINSSEPSHYKLSSEQELLLEQGRSEVKNGSFIKNEEVLNDLKQWLKKK